MQDYFMTLKRPRTVKQVADDELRESQIEYIEREGIREELARLRAENGNSEILDMVEQVVEITTRRHQR